MIYTRNETHDPEAKSWVKSANRAGEDFPIQNLPFGLFSRNDLKARIGVAIGDDVLDLHACADSDWLIGVDSATIAACHTDSLNALMSLSSSHWSRLRKCLFQLLHVTADMKVRSRLEQFLVPAADVQMHVPARIGDYTDFYASIYHATNVGTMFRPQNPLPPNYKWVPVGYHGRASSIVISGCPIRRPAGQVKPDGVAVPVFRRCKRLDYELEVGTYVGAGNRLSEPIPIGHAEEKIFGICLVNDWSARDVQTWEYQPLGPFLAKNFATTVSPWVVTLEALAPYRVPAFSRPQGDPMPLPHLNDPEDQTAGGIDLTLEVALSTARMRAQKIAPCQLSRGSFRDMYWTIAQLIAHHTSNGCKLRPGDLLASGTVSGNSRHARGCLLELTWNGCEPIQLPTGECRSFLENGDEVIIRGRCEGEAKASIGLGECRGLIEASTCGEERNWS